MNDFSYIDPRVAAIAAVVLLLIWAVQERRALIASRRRARSQLLQCQLATSRTHRRVDHPPQQGEANARAYNPAEHSEEDHTIVTHERMLSVRRAT